MHEGPPAPKPGILASGYGTRSNYTSIGDVKVELRTIRHHELTIGKKRGSTTTWRSSGGPQRRKPFPICSLKCAQRPISVVALQVAQSFLQSLVDSLTKKGEVQHPYSPECKRKQGTCNRSWSEGCTAPIDDSSIFVRSILLASQVSPRCPREYCHQQRVVAYTDPGRRCI
eukprot:959409-Amphidinium_carterae.1